MHVFILIKNQLERNLALDSLKFKKRLGPQGKSQETFRTARKESRNFRNVCAIFHNFDNTFSSKDSSLSTIVYYVYLKANRPYWHYNSQLPLNNVDYATLYGERREAKKFVRYLQSFPASLATIVEPFQNLCSPIDVHPFQRNVSYM